MKAQLREVSLEDELERCSTLSTIRNLTLPIKQGLLPKKNQQLLIISDKFNLIVRINSCYNILQHSWQ